MFLHCMLYNLYDIDDNIAIMVYTLVLKFSDISCYDTLYHGFRIIPYIVSPNPSHML